MDGADEVIHQAILPRRETAGAFCFQVYPCHPIKILMLCCSPTLGQIKRGVTREINAISVVFLSLSILAAGVFFFVNKKKV
jgi:hypothetical protein